MEYMFQYRPYYHVNKPMTIDEMCELSGRTHSAIKQSLFWMNIKTINKTNTYSPESVNKVLNNPKIIQNWIIKGYVNLKTVSDMLKITPTTVKVIAAKHGIHFKEQDLSHDGSLWFRKEDVPKIEQFINRDKQHSIKKAFGSAEEKIVETKIETYDERITRLQKEHPLVKDKRCFDLRWFPNSVPLCFAEMEVEND